MTNTERSKPRIMFVGKMRSGKTSAASHIEYTYGFQRLSFGTALKRTAEELFEGSDVYPFEPITEECPFSEGGIRTKGYRKPRRLYQDVGQALRTLDEDVWIRQLEKAMDACENMRNVSGIVIDDARQPNEIVWAKANGFTVIRINADEDVRLRRADALGDNYDEESMAHETERHIDSYIVDYDVDNDGDRLEFLARIDAIVSEIMAEGSDGDLVTRAT